MNSSVLRILVSVSLCANVVFAVNGSGMDRWKVVAGGGYGLGILRNTQLPDGETVAQDILSEPSAREFSLGQGYRGLVGLNYTVYSSLGITACGQFSQDYFTDGAITFVEVRCYSCGIGPQFTAAWGDGFSVWFRSTPAIYFSDMRWVSLQGKYTTRTDFAPAFGLGGSLGGGKKVGRFEIGVEVSPEVAFPRIREITRTYSNGATDRLIYSKPGVSETGTALRDRVRYSRESQFASASSLGLLLTLKMQAARK